MADEPAGRTSLGVLHEILTNLGDSNTYITVVDALEALLNVLGSGGIGQAVSDWLAAHPEATTTVQNGSITLLKLANDVTSAINGKAASSDLQTLADNLATLAQTVAEKADASDLEDKADIDGYYSQLTAGLAENLIGRGDAVPAEYLYRTAGGTADIEDGIATIDCIKGNTLVWNQMVQAIGTGDWRKASAATIIDISDGVVSVTPTTQYGGVNYRTLTMPAGHTFLLLLDYKIPTSGSYYAYTNKGVYFFVCNNAGVDAWQRGSAIATVPSDKEQDNVVLTIQDNRASDWDTWSIKNVQLFDLTLMFGAGNEPSTVEEFEAMFPLPYYPYSAPKMLPVDIRGVETVGFNQWDAMKNPFEDKNMDGQSSGTTTSTSGLIPVLPNVEYELSHTGLANVQGQYVRFYDASGQVLGGMSDGVSHVHLYGSDNFQFTTADGAWYCKLMIYRQSGISSAEVMATNPCLHLVWSGYRNGEYEEHWSAERTIDTSRFFPTGLKKVGDKADALYDDHYDTVIGSVDLGTLNWFVASNSNTEFRANRSHNPDVPMWVGTTGNIVSNCRCAEYETLSPNDAYMGLHRGIAIAGDSYISVGDSTYTDATAFKTAMSGVILYYELATPTTAPIDPPLNLSYKVSDFGTERIMVDETADAPQTAPVPMEVEYGLNAIDTIRRLPKEYQSHKSMGQLTAALESSLGIDITETWDEDDQRYEYEVSSLEVGTDDIEDGAVTDAKLAQTGGVLSDVAALDDSMGAIVTVVPPSANIFDGKFTVGEQVATSSGAFVAGSSYARTDHIPIKAGVVNIGIKTAVTQPFVAVHYCLYDADKQKLVSGNGNVLTVNATSDMQYQTLTATQDGYLAFDIYAQNANLSYYVSQVADPTEYVPHYDGKTYIKDAALEKLVTVTYGKSPAQAKKASFVDGETMVADSNSIMKDYQIVFFAKLGTMGTISIGHGQSSYGYYVTIDDTNVSWATNGSVGTTIPHELTISDYILVIIEVDKVLNAKLTIATMGGVYTKTSSGWTGRSGEVFAKNVGGTLSDAILTWSTSDYQQACWAFGDSYFATNTPARWPYWVVSNWGYDNVLLNAYPGEASANAYNDFVAALTHGTPKYLIWCLGMNDHDTSTAANAVWLANVETIKTICARNGITLILATIPNVTNASYNNTHKNQYVRESGYRYIDFASAVDGVNGWLSEDGVHPNEYGARLLAAQAISDCPELLQSRGRKE